MFVFLFGFFVFFKQKTAYDMRISELEFRRVLFRSQVILSDINAAMLGEGRKRLVDHGLLNVPLVQANAEQLPFEEGSFDCITIGFGLRNVTDKDAALRSMTRCLNPGGRLLVLEFSKRSEARRVGN